MDKEEMSLDKAREIINKMSENELHEYIFFYLQEISKKADSLEEQNMQLKEKLERIRQYAHNFNVLCTEDIEDYIDDDKEGNAEIIDDLREEREHWRDIEKLIEGKDNLYIDFGGMNYE